MAYSLGIWALHSAGPWPQLSVPWHQIWNNVSPALSLVSSASWMQCQHLAVIIHCFPFETQSKFYWYVLSLYSSRLCVVEMAVSSCLSLLQTNLRTLNVYSYNNSKIHSPYFHKYQACFKVIFTTLWIHADHRHNRDGASVNYFGSWSAVL